jgi:hypothetical protein
MQHSRLRLAILVLSIATVPACRGTTGIEPSPAQAAGGGSVTIDAAASEVHAVTGSATGQQAAFRPWSDCGGPYVAPVGLIVRSTRHVNVHVREIRTRVFPSQASMPPVTFPAPLLIQEFGTTLVQARSERIFPFRVMVGCQFKGATVAIDVEADDDQGRRHAGRVTVAVR